MPSSNEKVETGIDNFPAGFGVRNISDSGLQPSERAKPRKNPEADYSLLDKIQNNITVEDDEMEVKPVYIEGVGWVGKGNDEEGSGSIESKDNGELGYGGKLVVLWEIVSGVDRAYRKGEVVRASKLSQSWGLNDDNRTQPKEPKDVNAVANDLGRLIKIGAVRAAMKSEENFNQVEVEDIRNSELVAERQRRMELERQLEEMQSASNASQDDFEAQLNNELSKNKEGNK